MPAFFPIVETILKCTFWYRQQLLFRFLFYFLNRSKMLSFHRYLQFWEEEKVSGDQDRWIGWLRHDYGFVFGQKFTHKHHGAKSNNWFFHNSVTFWRIAFPPCGNKNLCRIFTRSSKINTLRPMSRRKCLHKRIVCRFRVRMYRVEKLDRNPTWRVVMANYAHVYMYRVGHISI